MGLLDSFEKGLERAVNGAFAKTFRSGIQPVEIASALKSELDTKAAVVRRDRILVPHTFTVRLASNDYQKMRSLGPELDRELTDIVERHAANQGYSFAGHVSITLTPDPDVATGTLQIDTEAEQSDAVSWSAVVDINGQTYPLSKSRTVIGRGSDADITVADAGTSRKHVEILWDGSRAMARDLGSTNGSKINGVKTRESGLEPGSVITIGRTDITFRVVPTRNPRGVREFRS